MLVAAFVTWCTGQRHETGTSWYLFAQVGEISFHSAGIMFAKLATVKKPALQLFLVSIAIGLAACGDGAAGEPCDVEGATRCVDDTVQQCADGAWFISDTCDVEAVCHELLGCVECLPELGDSCSGDDAYTCEPDGTFGELVESCDQTGCINGECSDDCSAEHADAIYALAGGSGGVILYRVNPNIASSPFAPVATVDCPCTPSDDPQSCIPVAMAVDRDTQAWLFYGTGDLFLLDPATAECTFVAQVPPISDPDGPLDGLYVTRPAFATDRAGSNNERMYFVASSADSSSSHLAVFEPAEQTIEYVAPLGDWAPDLIGTGHGELFGFVDSSRELRDIDATTGEHSFVNEWSELDVGFAHVTKWRGDFYVFTNTSGSLGIDPASHVYRLDADSGSYTIDISDHGLWTLAAATSTCAPQ